mmetsp:Transcript_13665/g.35100  ORF Transcript_13665/g.35100 Transcript_13665/m.35100 type:complete len:183 (-) Transcript_13665:44-592(-)
MWMVANMPLGHAPDGLCLADCIAPEAAAPRGCPSSRSSKSAMLGACSGHGTCASATGACDCRRGYAGADCAACEAGYERVDMLPFFACTPAPGGGILLSSDPRGGSVSPLAAGLVAGLMVALITAVGIVVFFVWRTTRQASPNGGGVCGEDKGKDVMAMAVAQASPRSTHAEIDGGASSSHA